MMPRHLPARAARARLRTACRAGALALVVLACSGAAQGDTSIRLKSWASVRGGAVTLGDVAEIRGDDAAELSAIVLTPVAGAGSNGWGTVDLAMVRTALEQHAQVSPASLTLQGSRCAVRLTAGSPANAAATEPSAPPRAGGARTKTSPTGAAIHGAASPGGGETGAAPTPAPGSVRAAIVDRLAALYDVDPAGLRVQLTGKLAVDEAAPEGSLLVIEPGASSASGRVPLRLDFYAGDMLTRSANLIAQVQVRREVLVAGAPIARGEAMDLSRVRREWRWLSAGAPAPVGEGELGRAQARRAITPGTVITVSDLSSPVLVRRGQEATIHVLSGEVRLKVKARAMGEGRLDDVVAFRMDGSNRTFDARLSGPAEAVKLVSGEGPPPPPADGRDRAMLAPSDETMFDPVAPSPRRPVPSARSSWDVDERELAALDAAVQRGAGGGAGGGAAASAGASADASPAGATKKFMTLHRDNQSTNLRRARDARP